MKKTFGKLKNLKPRHYLIIFFVAVLYFGAVIGIINYQNTRETTPPKLTIESPKDGDIATTKEVTVQGISERDTEIFIGDIKTATDKKGAFTVTVPLKEGANSVKVVAEKRGLKSEKSVTVNMVSTEVVKKAPAPVTKPTVKKVATKTVSARKLNNSGPETFWLLEAGTFAAAGAAWQVSRKRLKEAFRN